MNVTDDERVCVNRLCQKGVKPTSTRILVLRELMKASSPVSLQDIESALDTVDRSTIFRALVLFREHDLVHDIEDGSGSVKYELCESPSHCSVDDMHPHFYCEYCHQTFCLDCEHVPLVALPEGFLLRGVNYVLKGICSGCREKWERAMAEN
ncbi:MAG: Fur family transcriptional regulator [Bacteroidaceae bacterium]|jgi:Fur family ferric uptake transcriptional regulator